MNWPYNTAGTVTLNEHKEKIMEEKSQERFNYLMQLRSDYSLALQLGCETEEETAATQALYDDVNAELAEYGFGSSDKS